MTQKPSRSDQPAAATGKMRWFRRSEDTAPRLISLSPLRGEAADAASARASAQTHWAFQYTSTVDLSDIDDDYYPMRTADDYTSPSSHLPCTLKRKPAVRRRTGGIYSILFHFIPFYSMYLTFIVDY